MMATEIVISDCLTTEILQNKRCASCTCGHLMRFIWFGAGIIGAVVTIE